MSETVLMLDDDARYLELLALMLETEGFKVISSTNAEDLERLARLHRPDVIVMDILMQEHNGIEIAQNLRNSAGGSSVPIIFVSAWTGSGRMKLPRNSDRLFKPFTAQELVSAINGMLKSNTNVIRHDS